MGGAHELGFSLQVALTTNLGLRPLVKERRLLTNLGELILVGRPLHQRMTGDTSQPAVRVGTSFPIKLHSALMATEASFVLDFRRLPRVFAKRDHPADTLPTAGGNVITSRSMA